MSDEQKEASKLTPEQEAAIKQMQELQGKINEASKTIGETLRRLGLTLYVEHQIKIVPMQKQEG